MKAPPFDRSCTLQLQPESAPARTEGRFDLFGRTELPSGYFQFRAAVREAGTGKIGTISRYLEIPNLGNGKPAMSTLYLFAVDASGKGANAQPLPMLSLRQIPHSQELRYAAVIYNAN